MCVAHLQAPVLEHPTAIRWILCFFIGNARVVLKAHQGAILASHLVVFEALDLVAIVALAFGLKSV